MDQNMAIQVENLTKCYRVGVKEQIPDTALSMFINFLKNPLTNYRKYRSLYTFNDISPYDDSIPPDIIWALKGISFEIPWGEVVGIIGGNGAGKSTLLKILSRITCPTNGTARIRGRVSSLLEVGTGFNHELTGRENIYLNGTVLGMKKKEVDKKFDEIVDFSGVEKFIDTPVKRYSSGMLVRLAFSVAAHLDPEILLVDEVLAVGDATFQRKCLQKMESSSRKGQTVILVSHNMAAIQTLCTSAILLKHGKIISRGQAPEVVTDYLKAIDSDIAVPINHRIDRQGAGRFRFKNLIVLDNQKQICDFMLTGENYYFCIKFAICGQTKQSSVPLEIGIIIRDHQDIIVTTLASFFTDESPVGLEDDHEVFCFVPKLPLLPGQYHLDLWCATSSEEQDWLKNALPLRVEPGRDGTAAVDSRKVQRL